jgi:2-dehydro-3-deoxygluconokinase
MPEVILFGEPMVMFVADTTGPLEEVEHFTRSLAGAEVNVAIGLTRQGHSVSYVTRLGDDTLGRYIQNKLKSEGIAAQITLDDRRFTGFQLKERVLTGDPLVCYFRRNSAASGLSPADADMVEFKGAWLLHVTGIPPALSDDTRKAAYRMIERAKEAGLFVSFDPNLRPSLWENKKTMIQVINDLASKCDMVIPGYKEGKILMGSDVPEEIASFYRRLGVKMVVVKLGGRGSYTRTADDEFYQPCMPVDKIVDTVGAGDGFAVGVLSGLLEDLPLRDAVERGNAIGALQLRHTGDNEGLPTPQILKQYLEDVKNGVFANGY